MDSTHHVHPTHMKQTIENLHNTNQECSARIFGYGSLLWKPDFNFTDKKVGFIKGFKRRFYQGNDTHRGNKHQTGRVATLVPSKQGIVWGVMFEVKGHEDKRKAMGGLTQREVTLGGYDVIRTHFYPRDNLSKPIEVILFIATRRNKLFLGKSSIDTMAMQIVAARGFAGPNTEYVTRLADYIKQHIPEDDDEHLFALDKRVRQLSAEKYCLHRYIGQEEFYEKETDDATME